MKGESEKYITCMCGVVETCEYGTLKEKMLRIDLSQVYEAWQCRKTPKGCGADLREGRKKPFARKRLCTNNSNSCEETAVGTRTLFGNFFGNNRHSNYARIMAWDEKSSHVILMWAVYCSSLASCSGHCTDRDDCTSSDDNCSELIESDSVVNQPSLLDRLRSPTLSDPCRFCSIR